MRDLNPEMNRAHMAVCKDPAMKIIGEFPNLDFEEVSSCLNGIYDFLRSNNPQLGEVEYLLEVKFNDQEASTGKISSQNILDCLKNGANIIQVNTSLETVGVSKISIMGIPEISGYSRENQCCVVHVINGIDIRLYCNGLTLKDVNINNPFSQSLTVKKYSRQASDYIQSIIDHYKHRVQFADSCSHWDPPGDRNKRILYGKRRTEMIFHKNLWTWLEENLDATVYGTVNKLSTDQTDIEIHARNTPLFYILEIKWLGINSSKTSHSWDRLERGITQVINYLEGDPQCLEACLVTYDGRELEEFKKLEDCGGENNQWKEFRKCGTKEFPEKGRGLLLFLENKTASERNM